MAMRVEPIDVGIDVSKNSLAVAQESEKVVEIVNETGSIRTWLKSLPGPARIGVEATNVSTTSSSSSRPIGPVIPSTSLTAIASTATGKASAGGPRPMPATRACCCAIFSAKRPTSGPGARRQRAIGTCSSCSCDGRG